MTHRPRSNNRWQYAVLAAVLWAPGCGDSTQDDTAAAGSPAGGFAAGSQAGSGGSSVFDASVPSGGMGGEAGQPSGTLVGVLRDFNDSHPDFESTLGDDRGFVAFELGADGKPVYAGGGGTTTTTGKDNFDQWYRDVEGVNASMSYSIPLVSSGDGLWSYDNQEFFPLDDQLLGNQDREHNYHFTYELHTTFHYKGGEVFRFRGDDDLFVFINGRLAMDLGGVHSPEEAEADLDELSSALGITTGNQYSLDFFFAERHTTQSTFRIDTTIDGFVPAVH